MKISITTFLMFEGRAEEAINFYISVFPNAGVVTMERYAAGQGGAEGSVKQARVRLGAQTFLFIDSPVKHAFTFTPAMSLFERLFNQLSRDGQILMPLGSHPFSKKFGWLSDRFGVSWQLSFAASA
jgi:predicted 3-demethylubiquinone-9 3-methyltransferase (glyoxalase superfamily)